MKTYNIIQVIIREKSASEVDAMNPRLFEEKSASEVDVMNSHLLYKLSLERSRPVR